jgi:hypothetical protein
MSQQIYSLIYAGDIWNGSADQETKNPPVTYTLWSTAHSASFRQRIRTIPWGRMAVHLADKASASTTSPASSRLANSENIACCGCVWK